MWKIRFFLSDLPLPSIRSSSRSNANNSFKKHWGHFPQVRYFVKTLVGEARLPSAVEMEKDRQVTPVFLDVGKQKINILVLQQVDLALQKKDNTGFLRRRSDTGGKCLACQTNTSTRWELYRWLSLETTSTLKCTFCYEHFIVQNPGRLRVGSTDSVPLVYQS